MKIKKSINQKTIIIGKNNRETTKERIMRGKSNIKKKEGSPTKIKTHKNQNSTPRTTNKAEKKMKKITKIQTAKMKSYKKM